MMRPETPRIDMGDAEIVTKRRADQLDGARSRLSKGEDAHTEFKRTFDNETIETLCAFANTTGGSVFLGVDDNGGAVGVSLGKESIQQYVNQIKQCTSPTLMPDILEHSIDGKAIVELRVQEYPVKPVSCRNRYFKRVMNANHTLSTSEVVHLHLRALNTSWDSHPTEQHSLDDISLDKVHAFIERVNRVRPAPLSDTPLTVLRKYGLVRDDKITNGCYLLFAADDIPETAIELGRFQTPTVIKDSARYKGDLLGAANAVIAFITKHINRPITISGSPQHAEDWEYPLDALREVVINAIVHRDYTAAGDTIVKIFDDRIECCNPGGLPPGLTVADLLAGGYASQPRNRLVAEMFKEAGVIEKFGSGIGRILAVCRDKGVDSPVFEEISGGFRVTIYPQTPRRHPEGTQKSQSLTTLTPRCSGR